MKNMIDFRRSVARGFGLAAIAVLALSAFASQRAEALTLINPGAAPAAKYASEGLTTEVRGHGHGGGGHFRGHGGGFRAGHVFRGGGIRYGGYRRHGYRFAAFHRHRHFHRHFYRPYYAQSYYYPYGHCRVILTYYGPRKICRYRTWHHHHRRHHWRYW